MRFQLERLLTITFPIFKTTTPLRLLLWWISRNNNIRNNFANKKRTPRGFFFDILFMINQRCFAGCSFLMTTK